MKLIPAVEATSVTIMTLVNRIADLERTVRALELSHVEELDNGISGVNFWWQGGPLGSPPIEASGWGRPPFFFNDWDEYTNTANPSTFDIESFNPMEVPRKWSVASLATACWAWWNFRV